jgi:hypothetical protein
MKERFIKVDLHVHSPASPCYTGKKADDQEYIRILRKAAEEGIEVIAITDHNSIEGYKKILSILSDLQRERKYLLPIVDSKQAQERLKEIDEDLDVFKSLLILPGVEFQTSNSVHLLVIFNPKYDVSEIEKFLCDAGFDLDSTELHESISQWCVLDLLTNTAQLDCFCIDAHTDSDKGMYKSLQGKTRGKAFCNNQLKAVSFKSQDTVSKIEALLSNKEFSRSIPISYVKFSDAHSLDSIGKHYTWMRLDAKDYESLVNALGNPIECISIEKPEIASIIQNLIKEPQSIFVDSLDDYESIAKSIIALANSGGGYCLIGVNQEGKCKGVDYHPQDGNYDDLYKNIRHLWVTSGEFRMFINDYELQGKKYLISIHVKPLSGVSYFKDDELVYRQHRRTFTKASPEYIETIVETGLLKIIEGMIQPKIEDIENNLTLVKGSFDTLRLLSRIRDTLISISSYSSVSVHQALPVSENNLYNAAMSLHKDYQNGLAVGNIIFIDEALVPRYPYAYLRLSAPVFGQDDITEPSVKKNSVIISERGCVFLIDKDSVVVSDKPEKYLVLSFNCPPELTLEICSFFALYLKSTFLLWYLLSVSEYINLYKPEVFRRIRIPRLNLKDKQTIALLNKVHDLASNLISQERKFLQSITKGNKSCYTDEELDELITTHNRSIAAKFAAVDHYIYDILHLKEDEIVMITQRVKYAGLYVDDFDNKLIGEEMQEIAYKPNHDGI